MAEINLTNTLQKLKTGNFKFFHILTVTAF